MVPVGDLVLKISQGSSQLVGNLELRKEDEATCSVLSMKCHSTGLLTTGNRSGLSSGLYALHSEISHAT